MIRNRTLGCAALVGLLSGCSAGASSGLLSTADSNAALGPDDLDGTTTNGVLLNGWAFDGSFDSSDGVTMNGIALNGTQIDGSDAVTLNGATVTNVSLGIIVDDAVQNQFVGYVDGRLLTAGDFGGAIMIGTLSNNTNVRLRIDSVVRGEGLNADLFFYGVSYETIAGWVPLCGLDARGSPILAIPLLGTWNYHAGVPGGGSYTPDSNLFTFGCREHGAIAKCIEGGYKPWKSIDRGNDDITLAAHHVACTRMLRADYCGDGKPWTVNGTWINVVDGVGIHDDWNDWGIEAEWNQDGAVCTASMRNARWHLTSRIAPSCFREKLSRRCGSPSHFEKGTLLVNQYDGQGRHERLQVAGAHSQGEMSTEKSTAQRPTLGEIIH